jgi:uncharacterized protein YggU (UPF0235/DUF167 family)
MTQRFLRVHVVPSSKREIVIDRGEGKYDIAVRQPAARNLANARVRELVAGMYKVSIGKVRIYTGHHSPGKIVIVDD